jgi:hypothetical protein
MSNAYAIAAVTTTLRAILTGLQNDFQGLKVTTLPVDKARDSNKNNQLNLFLYQTLPNAAWSNSPAPRQVLPGESGMPPLALKLYYLLTAYGSEDDAVQPFGHQILGSAMSLLHDHALLGPDEIRQATSVDLPQSDLDRQIERVRITLQPLSVDEISKLWTGFQSQYRLSVAYEATVVLIDSTQPARMPLPVLTRGRDDRGVSSQPDLIPPFPALDELVIPQKQPSARLNDILTLKGHHLDGANIGVIFSHPLWDQSREIAPQAGATGTQLSVVVPNQPALWPAGFYTVAVAVQRPDESYRRTTNQVSFALAPTFTIAPQNPPAGQIQFTVTCSPEVRPTQRAALLLGDREILASPHNAQTNTLTLTAQVPDKGDYWVRLRLDGVDSLLVVDRSTTPPVFDPNQKVSVI